MVAEWVYFDQPVWDLELEFDLQGLKPDFDLWDPELDFVLSDPVPDLQDLVPHPQIDLEHLD